MSRNQPVGIQQNSQQMIEDWSGLYSPSYLKMDEESGRCIAISTSIK